MVCVKSLQLDLNRVLLLAVGLWPYKQSKFTRAQVILFYGILVTCIIFQFTTFVTTECNSQFVIEVLSAVFFFITLMIKYNTFSFNMDTVKYLLEDLQHIYCELRDNDEVAILRKYGTKARRYTYVLMLLSICGVSPIVLLPFWPIFLGRTVLPMNESRSHVSLQITTEYFVSQEKYFYLILLHINIAFCIGLLALLATGTMTITYWQYACGMFQVACYRVEQIIKDKTLKISNISKDVQANLMYGRIICAIDMHRKALTFVKHFLSKIEIFYFFLMSSTVITLSLNLYRVFDELTSGMNIEKLITSTMFLTVAYILMFLANYTAQQVKDHNDFLFVTVYNVQWYTAPLYVQRTILFLLQKGTKTFNMNIVGLLMGSLENFAMMASTSISYFTVIYSMRQ
ncbi:uncharacterized protein LOC116851993 [Odontomachus brunneus]|uniref:uncharacterized protein LOC116851993 n=1 Tax=Odontomachus brunneus TaxID=486640 RepID=UPI0013F18682|nr:uncharacterized protein LOC116851993 [Odontomachus brunneus]